MPAWLTVKPLLIALAALVATVAVQQVRVSRAHTATAEVRAQLADVRASIAEQREQFEREARATEQRQREALAGVAADYQQRMTDARATSDRVVAELRAGTERLRDHWQGCLATADLSGAASSAAGIDDGAELRRQGAGDLVSVAAECDAQVIGLQSAIRVMQGAGQ